MKTAPQHPIHSKEPSQTRTLSGTFLHATGRFLLLVACYPLIAVNIILFIICIGWFLPLLPVSRAKKAYWSRLLLAKNVAGGRRVLQALGLLQIRLMNGERLTSEQHYIFVANHPSLIDAFLVFSYFPDTVCIIKNDLTKNRCFNAVIQVAGHISNLSGNDLIDQCVHTLQAGISLLIFPEGTRSKGEEPLKFKRGVSAVALRSGVPIVPLVIRTHPAVGGNSAALFWPVYRRVEFTMETCYPIRPAVGDRDACTERDLSFNLLDELEQLFRQKLAPGGH